MKSDKKKKKKSSSTKHITALKKIKEEIDSDLKHQYLSFMPFPHKLSFNFHCSLCNVVLQDEACTIKHRCDQCINAEPLHRKKKLQEK